jgi:hypothetical protein
MLRSFEVSINVAAFWIHMAACVSGDRCEHLFLHGAGPHVGSRGGGGHASESAGFYLESRHGGVVEMQGTEGREERVGRRAECGAGGIQSGL